MARRKAVSVDAEPRKMGDDVRSWLADIAAARKREDDYRKDGKRIRDIYAGAKKDSTPFNILFSNVEIIAPSLFSMTPRPVVERRFKDNDLVGKAAAEAGQRGLEFLLDTNIDGYDTFYDAMQASVLDGLLPGRGITGIKYDADTTGDVKGKEMLCPEITSWDRVYFGYAKKWSRTPWMAFDLNIDKDEAKRLFGEKIADEIEYTAGEDEDGKKDPEAQGEHKTARVYQIWDKDGGRKIRWVSRHYPEAFLKVEDDPLGLTGFFKIPQPLQFIDKTNDMLPTAMYLLYENQAEELNRITMRINRLVGAMKARGVYDAALGSDIEKLMDGDDNELVPTEKGNSLAAERGLSGAIWFMPLEVLQQTLQALYAAREACKQVIYEIMGISDIVRGASKASETLGAQQLKSQWGTLRLKNKQAEVQRYARDLLRMMLEVAASKFSQDTWAKMTGLPYLTDIQFEQLQAQAVAMQQQAATVQQQATITGQPVPPEMMQQAQQQMQQLQQQLQAPKWADVLKVLNDDLQRAYRIDIETNSTIEPEAAEDQKNITELMNAIGQFTNGVGPMIQQGVLPFDVAKNMLLAITRRFRFGREIEDDIQAMQPPKKEDDGKEQAAQQQLQQATQKQMATDAQLKETEGKLVAAQEQIKLITREHGVDLKQQSLDYDEKIFKIEQKVAHETIVKNAAAAGKDLDTKKQMNDLGAKQAQTEQKVAQKVDSKTGEAVAQLGNSLKELATTQKQIADTVQQHGELIQQIEKISKAPRKRTAIRDSKGELIGATDEVMQ